MFPLSRLHLLSGLMMFTMGTFFAISCTMTQQGSDSGNERSRLSEEEQQRLDDMRSEIEVGRNMAGRLLEFYGAYQDESLVRYVNEVGGLIASHSPFPERRFMFDILDYEQPNAFASPGGYILISLGAIRNARNEAELAAILGHEIAHVGLQHMYQTLKSMDEKELEEAASEASAHQIPQELMVRRRPEPEDNPIVTFLARYMSGSVAGLNVLKAARAGMALMLEQGLGAELEFEADYEGVRYAINAGYHPTALIEYLCRIEVERGGSRENCRKPPEADRAQTILDRTHPPVALRIERIEKLLKEMEAEKIVGAHGQRRFLHYQGRLTQN